MSARVVRVITVFDKRTEKLVAKHPLPGVTIEFLNEIFNSSDPYMYDCYPVTAEIAAKLKPYAGGFTFDFGAFDYFVEATEVLSG